MGWAIHRLLETKEFKYIYEIMGHGFRGTANVNVEISENENIVVFQSNVEEEIREFTDKINIGLMESVY